MSKQGRNLWWPWLGFLLAIGLRLWQLGMPTTLVSDEISFVRDGQRYLIQQAYFDPHPPLGKEQLGAVFTFFGYTPFTWRIINAVEGALLAPLLWWLAWRLTRRRAAAALAVVFTLLDGLLLVDSRLGLINVPYLLYSLAALAAVLKALEARRPTRWLAAAGLAAGAAVSVKWLALSIVLPSVGLWFWPNLFGQTRRSDQAKANPWLASGLLILLPLALYWLAFFVHFHWLHQPSTFLATNLKMLNYHLSVPAAGDPYAQPRWGWLVMWQPFLYWSQVVGTKVSAVWSLPNPWLWWTGVVAFVGSLITGWRRPARRLLTIFLLASWLPFAFIQRIMYSYHALPFDLFLILLLAVIGGELWTRFRWAVIGYVAVALAVFLWFAPWYLNLPLSRTQYRWRQWLPRWGVIAAPSPSQVPMSAPR